MININFAYNKPAIQEMTAIKLSALIVTMRSFINISALIFQVNLYDLHYRLNMG